MHLNKEDLEKLREKLNLLIIEKADYSEILKASQELDDYITEFMSGKTDN
ncbi:MAG: aspartyl-phosphate phosphatase Spo0E family protein [Ruminiclostridium sp.]